MNTTEGGTSGPYVEDAVVLSTTALSCGDHIEASYGGTLVHRGRVTEMAPDHDLFWIIDYLTGSRRLLDVAEFKIVRVLAPKRTAAASDSTCDGRAGGR